MCSTKGRFIGSKKQHSLDLDCVVTENIHTPTTEGIGNSGGVGVGSKARENLEERGVERINYFPEGQL